MRALHSVLLAITCMAALAACGGGGGGSTGAAPAPAPPPPPPGPPPIALTLANYTGAASNAFQLATLSINFTLTGIAPVRALVDANIAQDGSGPCADGGSVATQVSDRDNNRVISNGDAVTIQFAKCATSGFVIDGTTNAEMQTVAVSAGGMHLVARITVTNLRFEPTSRPANAVTYDGTLNVDYVLMSGSDHYTLTNSTFTITDGAGHLTMANLNLDYLQDFDTFDFTLAFRGTVDSSSLGGTFTIASDAPFTGSIGNFPTTGRASLHGANATSATISEEGSAATDLNSVLLKVDTNGDGSADDTQANYNWSFLSGTQLFRPLRDNIETPPPSPTPPPNAIALKARIIQLGGEGSDIETDAARGRLYISVPSRNEIVIVSTSTYQVADRIVVGSSPRGIDLSLDGATLYVANNTGGSISAINLATRAVQTFEVALEQGSAATYDIKEFAPGKIVVTASPASSGFAWVLQLDTATGARSRIANGFIFRSQPTLLLSPDRQFMYMSEATLNKLDLTDPAAPIVLQSQFQSSQGLALNQAGTRIVLETGQVLRTGSFIEDSRLNANGSPQFTTSFSDLFLVRDPTTIRDYDGFTLEPLRDYSTSCPNFALHGYRHVEAGRWALLFGPTLCVVDTAAPATPPGQSGSPLLRAPPTFLVAATSVELNAIGAAVVADDSRGVVYVSLPSTKEVIVIATSSGSVLTHIAVSGRPQGLALSADGATLYAALNDIGSVAYIDTLSRSVTTTVDIATELGDLGTWDVIETEPNRIFVSANPGSGGIAYIVQIRRDQSNAASRVANSQIIRANPTFAASPDHSALFIGEGFSPESLYELDLTQPDAPLVARGEFGNLSGTGAIAASLDSKRVYLKSGQIVSAATLRQNSQIGPGVALPSADGKSVFVGVAPKTVQLYDAQTMTLTSTLRTSCRTSSITKLARATNRLLILGDDILCLVQVAAPIN